MSKFFIHRPIFAWVIAIFVVLAGIISITQLPVAQFPSVAPPTITVTATYPGATSETMTDSVLQLIEREMNGAAGLMYMESKAPAGGQGTLTLTFKPGTNADLAQVDVQNRLARAEPRLPSVVQALGVKVDKAMSNFLMILAFQAESGETSRDDIADYVNRNVLPEVQRLEGVGKAQLFAAGRAMRIWVDPIKLQGYGLPIASVNAAIAAQNQQISGGALGDTPNVPGTTMSASIVVPGQLTTPEQFGNVVLRSNADGSTVRIKDVARVELGTESYAFNSRLDGKPAVAMAVQLTSTANAMATAKLVYEKMDTLAPFLPPGVNWSAPYDTSKFVKISIEKVVHTLLEAIVLVFIVMLVFLQNIRYTLIPTIVVPIALLGTFGVMLAAGLTINILAMFAMVLVIGIVVDDAIVVVENVERIMAEEGIPPKEATIKAMGQIQGAVVGITVILVTVFLPLAMFSGATGNIYRQFSLVMAISIFFSGFFALTLTPALCATMLKPIPKGHAHDKKTGPLGPFYNWFNRKFDAGTKRYHGALNSVVKRSFQAVVVYLLVIAGVAFMFMKLPSAFLPTEDQGYVISLAQLPPGATLDRTGDAVAELEKFVLSQPETDHIVSILGFSFSGQGQNMGLAFTTLKDWSQRSGAGSDAQSFAGRTMGAMMALRDGFIYTLVPPSIPELGNSDGFTFRLLDRGAKGHAALLEARNMLMGKANQSPILTGVRFDGVDDAPQWQVNINRDAVYAQRVSMGDLASTLATALGSSNSTDFPNQGYMQRVTIQADAHRRMQPEDVMRLTVPNADGKLVELSTMVSAKWISGPMQVTRYNGYPSMSITGSAKPGYTSGQAMAEMEKLALDLPEGFGYEWTGQSLDEKKSGSSAMLLYAFSILAVFLCLAALYESWSIPLSVMLVVPLGVLGALAGMFIRGMPNDIYFQVALITVIGLSAKNAILIVEFAKDLHAQGMSAYDAALEAAHLRFRPILMTSLAFILGVVPLYIASGASAASQREIGTGVFWGMVIGTPLSIFLVPIFFIGVFKLFGQKLDQDKTPPASTAAVTDGGSHHD
ncbi:efflux RND transporter permease subunit [Comamonas sp. CMM01]|uniref:efflux RND transporter permease subunit n=1 Tax=Comamonas TaxID=283 RepID=UPI000E12E69A|nr:MULTISPECIES: efflux RND transporter permease subunit [Comamonas]MBD9533940.1 efflux RND transporter permease subunit [Comamonas sp. CMM01]MBV7419427.1 efflux RND transporter permease subunit [Comamonas sp. CMM03]MDH0049092.1 efflux RND transporter permease subunit [Comamonas terrigena]MDH0512119.1 efflux RND transporter permease subunit [Comamonas terrigena]MDH1091503.1 efflux RND transporter permease subunit [Comamonas terrigena]